MEIFTAILTVIAALRQINGGVASFMPIVAAMRENGQLTDDQVAKIKADAGVADAEYDEAVAAAKQRLG